MSVFATLIGRVRKEMPVQRQVLPWILIAAALLTLPNLLAAYLPLPSWDGLNLFFHGMCVLLLPCVLGMRVRLTFKILAPLALLVPAAAAYMVQTNTLPGTFTFLALMETNWRELSCFAATAWMAVGVALLLAPGIWYLVNKTVPAEFKLGLLPRVVIVLALAGPVVLDGCRFGAKSAAILAGQRLIVTFPAGTFFSLGEAWSFRSEIEHRVEMTRGLAVQKAQGAAAAEEKSVCALVIGESARYASFQINGYARPTSPLLARTEGLLSFSDVCATAPMTLASVPQLLTPTIPGHVRESTKLPSVLGAYRQAGYKVYWLSAQYKHGVFDTLSSAFSNDADESRFIGGTFDADAAGASRRAQDWQLLKTMDELLERREPKVLFVLHSIGSHGPYCDRYPARIARFPADTDHVLKATASLERTAEELQLLTNAYDNSICATDWFLANVIERLKRAPGGAWMYYISDHGENGADAPVGAFAHGTFTPDVLHVPMFVWLAHEYAGNHPAAASALRAHTKVPFSAMCTFHTLLDLGGLSCDGMKREWSAASPDFHPGPRLVSTTSDQVTDYDKDVLPQFLKRGGWHPLVPVTAQTSP